ncbi:MAG: hypothetical protein C0484_08270 [Rhodospirillum sp.]|nr:hypothetical protein [Rhodospirillum sp.]
MRGGAGNDLYLVDDSLDEVEEGAGGGKDTIRATSNYRLSDDQEIESFILDSGRGIVGIGNSHGNLITMVGAARAVMSGQAGNDTLKGGVGDDRLLGGEGDDIMAGGKGNDAYFVDSIADKVSELAGQGHDMVDSSLTDYTLAANVEDLLVNGLNGTGNALDNYLDANALANMLSGAAGNDLIFGRDGNDTINGGAGIDLLIGGTGDDSMTGGAGNDWYDAVDDAGDVIVELAGGGIDTVETNSDGHVLAANVENLALVGGAAISGRGNGLANVLSGSFVGNVLSGEAGNDTLDGAGGDDTLKGGAGNDLYLIDSPLDVVVEGVGGGKDTIRATSSYQLSDGQEIESLIFDSGNEITGIGSSAGNLITVVGAGRALMFGLAGNDTLKGGIGDDQLNGGAGSDIMAGGKGNDGYIVDGLGDKVSELAGQGVDIVVSHIENYTLGANLEDLIAAGLNGAGNALNNRIVGAFADNILSGMGGNDSLLGDMGNDTLLGGVGSDRMSGGSGDDSMNGGAGNDQYVVVDAGDIVTEAKGGGTDTIETNLNNFTLVANVEDLGLFGDASLNAVGNGLANKMTGNTGQNMLLGEAGNDTLDGAGGNDTLKGGAGNDVYLVDNINDVVEEGIGGGKDTIRATATYQLSEGLEIESLILDSSGIIGGFGNSQGNLITMVGTGPAAMFGTGGNDTLTGGVGIDELHGDAGKDILSGGGALDVLVGGEDSDTLKGGAGDDVLTGGLGADALFGEAGADRFIYSIDLAAELGALGNDTINGFQKGVDKIDLRDLITDFGIDADDAFTGKYVILSKAGASTIVQFDQDGSAGGLGPVTLATVKSAAITAADLILETI